MVSLAIPDRQPCKLMNAAANAVRRTTAVAARVRVHGTPHRCWRAAKNCAAQDRLEPGCGLMMPSIAAARNQRRGIEQSYSEKHRHQGAR